MKKGFKIYYSKTGVHLFPWKGEPISSEKYTDKRIHVGLSDHIYNIGIVIAYTSAANNYLDDDGNYGAWHVHLNQTVFPRFQFVD